MGFLVLLASLFFTYHLDSDEVEEDAKIFDSHRVNLPVHPVGETTNMVFDIDDARFGIPQNIEIIIENRSDTPLELVKALTGCVCREAKLPTKPIQPGEFGKLELKITEFQPTEIAQKLVVPVQCKGPVKEIYLHFVFHLKDLAAFAVGQVDILIPYSDKVRNEPFTYLIPINLSDEGKAVGLKVGASQELELAGIKVVMKDGKPFVEVKVDETNVSPDGMSGELHIDSPYNKGVEHRIKCTIARSKPVIITPREIVLLRQPNSKEYKGKAILREFYEHSNVGEFSNKSVAQKQVKSEPSISIQADSLPNDIVKVKAEHVNKGINVLFFRADLSKESEVNQSHKGKVTIGLDSTSVSIPVTFTFQD
jgi:hypothetical protein